jgi:hypothetical protein
VRKLACALRAMEHFRPSKGGSKLPHSKQRSGLQFVTLVAALLRRGIRGQ